MRHELARHHVVWLTGPIEHLAEKIGGKDHRPLVADHDPVELVTEQLARRAPLALTVAELVIDVSEVDDDAAAAQIVQLLASDDE